MADVVVIEAGGDCKFCGQPDLECTLSVLKGGPYCCKECEEASK